MLVCTSRIESSAPQGKIVEMKAHVFGRVQGIGFRAGTKFIAIRLKIRGLVRNCEDGSVEIIAQGSKEQLEALLSELKSTFKNGAIEEIKVEFYAPKRQFKNFMVQV